MAGRGVSKNNRLYLGCDTAALDLSCSTLATNAAGVDFAVDDMAAYCWSVKGGMLGQGTLSFGPVNVTLYTDATAALSAHDVLDDMAAQTVYPALALGLTAAPVIGSVCFATPMELKSYSGVEGENTVTLTATMSSPNLPVMNYANPWGVVLHTLVAATAANTDTAAATVVDNGAESTSGGYMYYALTSVDAGTVTISVDDSDNGDTYDALSGATSGALSAPKAGIVQLGTTATVRRYLRWQVALAGGASTATFFTAFVRGQPSV